MTQERFSCENCSASPMDGRATFTMDASSTTMNWVMQSRIKASQRLSLYSSAVVIISLVPFRLASRSARSLCV